MLAYLLHFHLFYLWANFYKMLIKKKGGKRKVWYPDLVVSRFQKSLFYIPLALLDVHIVPVVGKSASGRCSLTATMAWESAGNAGFCSQTLLQACPFRNS